MKSFEQEFRDKLLIGLDLYRIDPMKQKLVSMDDPRIEIPYQSMKENMSSFSFKYKTVIPRPSREIFSVRYSYWGTTVTIPKNILLLDKNYGPIDYDKINQQSTCNGAGFQLLGERYMKRVAGKLPEFILAGERFEFDVINETINSHLGKEVFDFVGFKLTYDHSGPWIECAFNIKSKQFMPKDLSWRDIPADIVILSFRLYDQLDPIGWALKFGHQPYHNLNRLPLKEKIPYGVKADNSNLITRLAQMNNTVVSQKRKKGI